MKKRSNACLQRQRNKRTRHLARRQAKRRVTGAAQSRGQMVVCELLKTIEHFFPDLLERLRELEDCRRKSDYALSELLMAGIVLFVFQQGSRNALNNQRQEAKFKKHYQRLFKLRLPHLDTVHRVLCRAARTPQAGAGENAVGEKGAASLPLTAALLCGGHRCHGHPELRGKAL